MPNDKKVSSGPQGVGHKKLSTWTGIDQGVAASYVV
jgi:hypothetical protein